MSRTYMLKTTMLIKEIKDQINGEAHYSWTGRCNTVKVSILLKFICRFNDISIKISPRFLQVWTQLFQKGRGTGNKIENPEIDPKRYAQLISGKLVKTIKWRKDSLLNKWCCNNWTSIGLKMNLNIVLLLTHKKTVNGSQI